MPIIVYTYKGSNRYISESGTLSYLVKNTKLSLLVRFIGLFSFTHLLTYLLTCVRACVLACLRVCVRACERACVLDCLLVYLLTGDRRQGVSTELRNSAS